MIIKFSDMPSVYVYKSEGGKNKKYAEFIVGYCKAVGLMPNNKLCVRCSPHLALCLASACEKHGVGLYVVTGASGGVKENLEKMGAVVYPMAGGFQAGIDDAVSKGAYHYDQFTNPASAEYYKSVAAAAVAELGFTPDNFVDFIGSGATLAGFASALGNTRCYRAGMCDRDPDLSKNPMLAPVADKITKIKVEKTDVYAMQQKYAEEAVGQVNIGTVAALKAAENLQGTTLIYWQD